MGGGEVSRIKRRGAQLSACRWWQSVARHMRHLLSSCESGCLPTSRRVHTCSLSFCVCWARVFWRKCDDRLHTLPLLSWNPTRYYSPIRRLVSLQTQGHRQSKSEGTSGGGLCSTRGLCACFFVPLRNGGLVTYNTWSGGPGTLCSRKATSMAWSARFVTLTPLANTPGSKSA